MPANIILNLTARRERLDPVTRLWNKLTPTRGSTMVHVFIEAKSRSGQVKLRVENDRLTCLDQDLSFPVKHSRATALALRSAGIEELTFPRDTSETQAKYVFDQLTDEELGVAEPRLKAQGVTILKMEMLVGAGAQVWRENLPLLQRPETEPALVARGLSLLPRETVGTGSTTTGPDHDSPEIRWDSYETGYFADSLKQAEDLLSSHPANRLKILEHLKGLNPDLYAALTSGEQRIEHGSSSTIIG
jgi:hypothetical protein